MFTFPFLDVRFPSYGDVNGKTSAKTRLVYREKNDVSRFHLTNGTQSVTRTLTIYSVENFSACSFADAFKFVRNFVDRILPNTII